MTISNNSCRYFFNINAAFGEGCQEIRKEDIITKKQEIIDAPSKEILEDIFRNYDVLSFYFSNLRKINGVYYNLFVIDIDKNDDFTELKDRFELCKEIVVFLKKKGVVDVCPPVRFSGGVGFHIFFSNKIDELIEFKEDVLKRVFGCKAENYMTVIDFYTLFRLFFSHLLMNFYFDFIYKKGKITHDELLLLSDSCANFDYDKKNEISSEEISFIEQKKKDFRDIIDLHPNRKRGNSAGFSVHPKNINCFRIPVNINDSFENNIQKIEEKIITDDDIKNFSFLNIPSINFKIIKNEVVSYLKKYYQAPLFSWNDLPDKSDNFLCFLREITKKEWPVNTIIEKRDSTIFVSNIDDGVAVLRFDDDKKNAILEFDGKSIEFSVKEEEGVFNVYHKINNPFVLEENINKNAITQIYNRILEFVIPCKNNKAVGDMVCCVIALKQKRSRDEIIDLFRKRNSFLGRETDIKRIDYGIKYYAGYHAPSLQKLLSWGLLTKEQYDELIRMGVELGIIKSKEE